MSGIVVGSSTALWYLSRASGIVTLILLTASVLLGIVTSYRWSSPEWPRFVIEFVHRNVSLLVVAFLALHVATVVTDSFAPIGWKDAVLPFLSPYRPIWLGLGALACDLVLALVITSLLRHRLGFRTWRTVHWFAYLCWPLAVVHGLGTGSDTKLGVALVITTVCVVAVLVATSLRIASGLANRPTARRWGFAAWAFAPVVLAIWLASGPLASGWARRAGTPASVLAGSTAQASASTPGSLAPSPTSPPPTSTAVSAGIPTGSFRAQVAGTFNQSAPDSRGEVVVSLIGPLTGGATGRLDVELRGRPATGGGVALEHGLVTLTGNSASDQYTGDVVALQGQQIIADVSNPGGNRLRVSINFTQLDGATSKMAGIVNAEPTGSDAGRDGDR